MSTLLLLVLYCGGVLISSVGALALLYTIYLCYVHWKYSHLPSPKMPSFYCGHLPDTWKLQEQFCKEVPLQVIVDFWVDKVGTSKTFVVFFFHTPMVFTLDSAVVKEVVMNKNNGKTTLFVRALSTVFGERLARKGLVTIQHYENWRPYRQLFDPAFKKSYLKTLTTTYNDMINAALDKMKPLADGKTVVPLKKHILQLAQDIISKVAFSEDFSKVWTSESLGIKLPEKYELSIFSYLVNTSFEGIQYSLDSVFPALNEYLYPREARKFKKCVQALRKIGRDCIMRRLKLVQNGEEAPQDILTLMISSSTGSDQIEDLVDNFITFYLGGQETTAYTIMFTLILLAQNQNVLERLKQEIDDVLNSKAVVTAKNLEELQFMEQVIQESLRLYPPVARVAKTLDSELKLGDLIIPAGTNIRMMNANICRLPEHFDNPEDFNPDRFHPDNKRPSSFVFFPFGVGHRSCIGKHFAMMESKIVIARIIQTFCIKFPDDYKVITVRKGTLQPKDDLLCTLTLN